MFIAVLFTIARSRKQPKCPSTDEWIKKLWYKIKRALKRVAMEQKVGDDIDNQGRG